MKRSAGPKRRVAASMMRARQTRGRIWIESAGRAVFTDAAADLIEQIGACGSLSEAARRLGFSYRRAWMLLDRTNRAWPRKLVVSTTGGRRGGGASVTELGTFVLRTYRDLQLQLEHLLDTAGDPFAAGV
jgi:molybdate transport system regulatory protein